MQVRRVASLVAPGRRALTQNDDGFRSQEGIGFRGNQYNVLLTMFTVGYSASLPISVAARGCPEAACSHDVGSGGGTYDRDGRGFRQECGQ